MLPFLAGIYRGNLPRGNCLDMGKMMIFLYEKSSVDTVDGNHFPGPAVLMRLDYGNKDSTVWEFVGKSWTRTGNQPRLGNPRTRLRVLRLITRGQYTQRYVQSDQRGESPEVLFSRLSIDYP